MGISILPESLSVKPVIVLPSIFSISSVATAQTGSSSAAFARSEPKDGMEMPLIAEKGAELRASTATRAIERVRINLCCFDIVGFSFVLYYFGFASPFYN